MLQLSDVPEFSRNCHRRFSEHATAQTNKRLKETDVLRHNRPTVRAGLMDVSRKDTSLLKHRAFLNYLHKNLLL